MVIGYDRTTLENKPHTLKVEIDVLKKVYINKWSLCILIIEHLCTKNRTRTLIIELIC